MDIHEYQAKQLLAGAGVPIPDGGVAHSADEATYLVHEIAGNRWVVKAQIHSGARGKAGGVKICDSDQAVRDAATELLGRRLVTVQTGPEGKVCNALYVEAATDIERELYVAMVLDRASEQIVVVASAEGGVEIEELAEEKPDSILRQLVDPAIGLRGRLPVPETRTGRGDLLRQLDGGRALPDRYRVERRGSRLGLPLRHRQWRGRALHPVPSGGRRGPRPFPGPR